MSDEVEVTAMTELTGEALLSDNCLIIPTDLPAGTVITVSITIGGPAPTLATEKPAQAEKPKYMNGGRR